MSNSLIYTITALVAARFVAGVASDDRLALARSGNIALSALAWAGSRCYSLYLLHMPIAGLTALAFGRQTLGVDSAEGAAMLACAILVLFVVAESSYRMIERPFMSMGETISSSKRERAARAALAK